MLADDAAFGYPHISGLIEAEGGRSLDCGTAGEQNNSDNPLAPRPSRQRENGKEAVSVVDWQRILQGAGEIAQGMAYAMTVNRWLQLDDQSAFSEVINYVNSSSTGEIDNMDVVLLQAAATNFDLGERRRLVKFYALFKTAEYGRFGQFRGFPA